MVAAGSITVAVRVRPPTAAEAARLPQPCYDTTYRGDGALSTPAKAANTATLRDIVQIVDDRIITFDPDEKDRAKAFVERGFMPPGSKRYKDRRFMFDKVFGHEARQQDVYASTSQPLLQGLLDGYNATVFAYGATGCGKTHTISGTESDPGIIYLTMADLFQRIEDRKDEWNVEVMVTFLEIYNEEIRDLLAEPGTHYPRGGLSIREDKTVKVVGLVELKPRTAEEVKQIVLQGNLRRTQSPTHANETSSRSHAVLQVHVTQSPRTAALNEQRTVGTLSIIDLAGSERAAATSNMGQRMVEGANINKSLLALGNCINALCESGGAIRHVPYRNSKLTRLLKFSLGGNCKTVMIVCVAPTSINFDDTHNTLIYAERATKIKTKVVTRNVVNVDRHVGRYVEAINRLNEEVAELKQKLADKRNTEGEIVRRKKVEAAAEVARAKNDMKAKADQTKPSIMDGAVCSGKLFVAKIKLAAIQSRLRQLALGKSSPAQDAERALLQALAVPEEEATKPGSTLSARLQRSANSNAMFDATMRALSERRSEKLDDSNIENIKLDATCIKVEMERVKIEAEGNAVRDCVEDLAEVVVKLLGMLGRCTVMIGEAGNALKGSPTNQDGGADVTVQQVVELLGSIKEKNDDTFKELVGHSTEAYSTAGTSLSHFDNYGVTFTRRINSGPTAPTQPSKPVYSRRSSSYGSSNIPSSPSRRGHKSPRRSLRSSIAAQPYRRVSDKDKKGAKTAKSVQWRDEAGQGDLDDGGLNKLSPPVLAVVPASPADGSTANTPEPGRTSPFIRSSSLGGSESEWEDDNEKTDDSLNLSMNFMSMSLPPSTKHDSSTSSRPNAGKRSRPSRLDPSFLKSRSKASGLGSLAEDDESSSPERSTRPLSDMSVNQLSEDSGSNLQVPKHRERHNMNGSPSRRGPSTPKGGMSLSKSANSRRRSNIGPVRNDKGRRRSSMIPQLSPPDGESSKGGPRRVLLASPAKRVKRASLSRSTTLVPPKLKLNNTSGYVANISLVSGVDPNASMDFSSMGRSGGSRPTWR